MNLGLDDYQPLLTRGFRQHEWTLHFSIAPQAPPQRVEIDTAYDERSHSIMFGMSDGWTEVTPWVFNGFIDYQQFGDCIHCPGDANGNQVFDGLDVAYSINYLKNIGNPPPFVCYCSERGRVCPAADANGDCNFNGIDVSYSVNYLKSLGPVPQRCPDCLPPH